MSSHVHMIIGRHGEASLEGIIRDVKKYTSVKIIEAIRNNTQERRRELLIWLFERYSLYVTNLDLPAEQIWISYKDRADTENRIKELKYDFGLDSFCMDKFWATEAAFRTIMMGYNLMNLFRQIVLQSKSQATLSTLRFKMLCIMHNLGLNTPCVDTWQV